MHSAITEVGILYATGEVHDGWDNVGRSGIIESDSRLDDHGRPRLCDRRLRQGRFLDPELVGSWMGTRRLRRISTMTTGSRTAPTSGWRGSARRLNFDRTPRSRDGSASRREARAATCSATSARTSSASATTDSLRTEGTYGTSAADVKEIFHHVRGAGEGSAASPAVRARRTGRRGFGDPEGRRSARPAPRRGCLSDVHHLANATSGRR